jgi:hypothetical protein
MSEHPRNQGLYVYVAGLIVVIVIVVSTFTIWQSTDTSGTNALATDPQSTMPPAH